jgi:hypothetical protein
VLFSLFDPIPHAGHDTAAEASPSDLSDRG